MTARKNTAAVVAPKFAVVNSVPGSNYTLFQIKVWDAELGKSVLHSEGFATRIAAKKAVDADESLIRVDSFRVAQEKTDGVARPAKRLAPRTPVDTFNTALAESLSAYVNGAFSAHVAA